MDKLYLRDDFEILWRGTDPFRAVAAIDGETFREVKNRRTFRFEINGARFFAKVHSGVGWAEIAKNLITLRAPILGARNEFVACRLLEERGIRAPTVAAFGIRGTNPARRESFVVCDALEDMSSLEDVAGAWQREAPSLALKRQYIDAVADIARALHGAGVNHRDFYICHLLADEGPLRTGTVALSVIDLHRAQVRAKTPRRWIRRDLAALLFSSFDAPLTRNDWYRFVRRYSSGTLREELIGQSGFWQTVYRRGVKLQRKGRRES